MKEKNENDNFNAPRTPLKMTEVAADDGTFDEEAFAWNALQKKVAPQEKVVTEITSEKTSAELDEAEELELREQKNSAQNSAPKELALNPAVILEAMLFVGDRENKPLSLARAAELMRNVTEDDLLLAIESLQESYRAAGAPYLIGGDLIDSEKKGYRLELRREFESLRAKFYSKVREATLSQKAIDVLAIIAYKQPISADEVQKIRKEPSMPILTQLKKRDLITATSEKLQGKRVTVFRTTARFLQLFGLQSLTDIPQADEIDFR